MTALAPQIFGAAVVAAIVAAVLTFFYVRNQGEHLKLWAFAFGVSSIRQFIAALAIVDQQRLAYDVAIRVGVVVAGLLLLRGTYEFLERRLPRVWYGGAAVVTVWIAVAPMLDLSFLLATIPVFFFRSIVDLVTGWTILRRRDGVGAWTAGGALILWGLHRANYPFLRPIEWIAPWGFELTSVLAIVVAIGFLTMHYERLHDELTASEAKYRSMFEDALDGFIRTTPAGQISAANPALVNMLGYDSAEEMYGLDMTRDVYAAPEERAPLIQAHEEDGILPGKELRWKRKDDSIITVRVRGRRVFGADGNAYFEGSVRNVSEERAMREQLELARRMEGLGRLAGGIAHDFNNVLTAILAGIDLVEDEVAHDEDPSRELDTIRRSARQGADLSRRLLSFSRPELRDKAPIRFDDNVDDAIELLKRLIPENIALEVRLGAPSAFVETEPGQLERVVTNLVINAQQAVEDGGHITVETTTSAGDDVILSVRDDGHGMDEDTVERIFEPFYTTGTMGQGTGLGLATVFTVVNSMNGTIDVESELGVGTEFRVVLPRCEPSPAAADEEEPETAAADPAPPDDAPLVLLVEDEPVVRKIVKVTLENAGYRTIVAHDGQAAIAHVDEHLTDLAIVVTDVVMPRLSGPELVDQLLEKRPDLPYLFLSGYTADKMRNRGVEPRHFLEKPFTRAVLLERIKSLCRRPDIESSGELPIPPGAN